MSWATAFRQSLAGPIFMFCKAGSYFLSSLSRQKAYTTCLSAASAAFLCPWNSVSRGPALSPSPDGHRLQTSKDLGVKNRGVFNHQLTLSVAAGNSLEQPSSLRNSDILRHFASAAFAMVGPTEISSSKMFGGTNKRFEHESATLGCNMKFSIYFPPAAVTTRVPV